MSDVHNTSAQPGKRFNWLVAALIASLAVNLLIVGAVAARWYAGVGPGERYMRLTQTQRLTQDIAGLAQRVAVPKTLC
jgi:hypothetical protein